MASIWKRTISSLYHLLMKKLLTVISKRESKETVYLGVENREECLKETGGVYALKQTWIFDIEDESARNRLLEIIHSLEAKNVFEFTTPNARISFMTYGVDRKKGSLWLELKCYQKEAWSYLEEEKKLLELLVSFEFMQSIGWVWEKELTPEWMRKLAYQFRTFQWVFSPVFDFGISEFFSCFVPIQEETQIETFKGRMVEYIHEVLIADGHENSNLREFYEKIELESPIRVWKLPYSLPIVKMCYEYFKTGRVTQDISKALSSEYESEIQNFLLVFDKDAESNGKVIEKTKEYVLYEDNKKIFESLSPTFQEALKDETFQERSDETLEPIEDILCDLDANVIGYQIQKKKKTHLKKVKSVLELPLKNQREILECLEEMKLFFDTISGTTSRFLYSSELDADASFDLEKSVVCLANTTKQSNSSAKDKREPITRWQFKIATVKDLFCFFCQAPEKIDQQLTITFFKLLKRLLQEQYGEIRESKTFLEKDEVKVLSPLLAGEFIRFALEEKHFSLKPLVVKEFFSLVSHHSISQNQQFCYDARYCYDPTRISFVSEAEIKERYNLDTLYQLNQKLPDKRVLVTFNKAMSISKFANLIATREVTIRERFGEVEDDHVKFLGVSEVVWRTNRLNNQNMYDMIGYVTEPLRGKCLNWNVLLGLNNKELLKVSAYLLSKFQFNLNQNWNIWMEDDFHFSINILAKDFSLGRECKTRDFIWQVWQKLIELGYAQYNDEYKFPNTESAQVIRESLLHFEEQLDAFCEEHKLYYCSQKTCPVCSRTKYFLPKDFEETHQLLYEDEVAKHYTLDSGYNLKLYKPTCKEREDEIKTNVEKWVEMAVKSPTSLFFQDCFIPLKKVLNSSGSLLGYVYPATSFANFQAEEVCIELEKLKTLPRLKALIRLLLQVEQVLQQDFGFLFNPFEHVYLNAAHKRQVQILNIDFLQPKRKNVKETIKWVYQYISKVLQTDDMLGIGNLSEVVPKEDEEEKWNDISILTSLMEKLREAEKELTKYCSIHKEYYPKRYFFCPRCVKPHLQTKEIQFERKKEYLASRVFDEGGESLIYADGEDSIVKVFREDKVNLDFKNLVLSRVLEKKPLLETINQESHQYCYVMPKKILVDSESQKPFGYRMDKVEEAFPISILRDKVQVQELNFSRKDVLEILITVGEGIENLHHSCQIYIGDLNGRNILFDRKKKVYFLDFDGMGIDEIAPEFCTDGYIDPVSKKKQEITPKDDWYSFAIQAFYYLTYTHPFNGIYYEEENGRKVVLEIPDKMERRISLLGNHGMKPPTIAIPWDWMLEELKNVFLATFEGDYRESIVPYLKKQYDALFQGQRRRGEKAREQEWKEKEGMTEEEAQENGGEPRKEEVRSIIRVNPKFIAKEVKAFEEEIVRIICHEAAICRDHLGNMLLVIHPEKSENCYRIPYENLFDAGLKTGYEIHSVLFSEKEKELVFLLACNSNNLANSPVIVSAVNLEQRRVVSQDEIEGLVGNTDFVVNGHTLYWNGYLPGTSVIFEEKIEPDGNVVKAKTRVCEHPIRNFLVKQHTKFLFVLDVSSTEDVIFCNTQYFCSIPYNSKVEKDAARYRCYYDTLTKIWLVMNNYGTGIAITRDGEKIVLILSQYVDIVNFNKFTFEKGNLYIPNQDYLTIVNVITKSVKRMECHKIMTPSSTVYEINAYGFSVWTDSSFYEVRKG